MLFQKTLTYLPAQFLAPAAAFAAMFVWTHWLPPSELGRFTIVIAVREFALEWSSSWWTSFTVRYLTSYDGDRRSRYDVTDIVILCASSVLQIGLVAGAMMLALGEHTSRELVLGAMALTLVECFAGHNSARARAQHRVLQYTILTAAGPVIGLTLGIASVHSISPTAETLVWAYALAQLIALALARPIKEYRFAGGRIDRELISQGIAYGVPLVIAGVFYWGGGNAIRFVVKEGMGIAAVGLMSVGWSLGLRASQFGSSLVISASFPLAVDKYRTGGQRAALEQLADNGALLLAALMPLTAGIILTRHAFVPLAVAKDFVPVTLMILPISAVIGLLRNVRSHIFEQAFLVFERPRTTIIIAAVEGVLTTLLCAAGMWQGGLLGAALGCLVAGTITLGVSFTLARGAFGFYLRWSDVGRVVLGTAVMAAVLMVIPQSEGVMNLGLKVAIGVAVYAAVILIVTPRARQAVARLAAAA